MADLDSASGVLLVCQLSSFSIGEADDDEDDFVELRKAKGTAPSVRDGTGKVTKLGAVPLKPAEPSQGKRVRSVDGEKFRESWHTLGVFVIRTRFWAGS